MSSAALVLAAGRGERFGAAVPKAYTPLAGEPLVSRSLRALAAVHAFERLVPVIGETDAECFASLRLEGVHGLAAPVVGGAERQDSVRAGLASLPDSVEWVAVHDAARCLVTVAEVRAVLAAARSTGAAILAEPVRDTLKRVEEGVVVETPLRAQCWRAQTPQVFRVELLREALDKAEAEGVLGTDDAQLVERLGVPVHVVEGSRRNLKITVPEDLVLAEYWLRSEGEAP